MRIDAVPFSTVDWNRVPVSVHPGETGQALWRTLEVGNIRVRMVEYTAGYRADHWCSRGHVLLVLKGELITELADGTTHVLTAGMSYQVAEDAAPHRSFTPAGRRCSSWISRLRVFPHPVTRRRGRASTERRMPLILASGACWYSPEQGG